MSLFSWKVIILVSVFLALGNFWLVHVVTICPNSQEWDIERLRQQMRERLQRKDEEIRHLKNEERKQNEDKLRQILKLELIIQDQNKTIHDLNIGEGRKLKQVEEPNQIREEEIHALKSELHAMEESCMNEIRRLDRERRQCEHQLLEKEKIIQKKDADIRYETWKLQSMRNKCDHQLDEYDQLWAIIGKVVCAFLALLLICCVCRTCIHVNNRT